MRILVLCLYPISAPRHGGQHRVHQIVRKYRALGHSVEVAGILGSPSYLNEDGFVKNPKKTELSSILNPSFLMEDFGIGRLASEKLVWRNKLLSRIRTTPDLIHVEQPWLYQFAEWYAGQVSNKPPIIYSSQNVEHALKREILSQHFSKRDADERVELVKDVEKQACLGASVVVAVTEEDANWARESRARRVVLAPNGVDEFEVGDMSVTPTRRGAEQTRWALFVGSAHPPNSSGFFEVFANGLGCVAPDQPIRVVGGVCNLIKTSPEFQRLPKGQSRIQLVGEVSSDSLLGYLREAHVVLLPITSGGGSNLKTAEALWAGKYIVATRKAFRGYEEFVTAEGVFVADEVEEFPRLVRKALDLAPLELSSSERERRRKVLWENTLLPLEDALSLAWGVKSEDQR